MHQKSAPVQLKAAVKALQKQTELSVMDGPITDVCACVLMEHRFVLYMKTINKTPHYVKTQQSTDICGHIRSVTMMQ